jgi:hypothetical protein
MESASFWSKCPYNTEHAQPAWFYEYFVRRVDGFLLTGFKVDWPPKKLILNNNTETSEDSPIEMVFVLRDLYLKIRSLKSYSCLVEVEEFGSVKCKEEKYGIISKFCLGGASFIKELPQKEFIEVSSVDAMATLVW